MNQTRYVNIRDLHPTQRELTGLPFGLFSEDNGFLKKLYDYVARYHRSEEKDEVLFVLQQRYELMAQNTYALTRELMRKPEDVHVLNQLTPLLEGEHGVRFQLLQTDIAVDIDDTTVRYKQPGQIFIVGEDNHTWIRTALRVGQLEESAERIPVQPPELPPSLPALKPSTQRGAYSG